MVLLVCCSIDCNKVNDACCIQILLLVVSATLFEHKGEYLFNGLVREICCFKLTIFRKSASMDSLCRLTTTWWCITSMITLLLLNWWFAWHLRRFQCYYFTVTDRTNLNSIIRSSYIRYVLCCIIINFTNLFIFRHSRHFKQSPMLQCLFGWRTRWSMAILKQLDRTRIAINFSRIALSSL